MDVVSIAHRYGEDDRILADETAECLRKWLAMAERGELISVALAGERPNGDVVTGFSAAAKRYQTIGALETLKQHMISMVLDDYK